MLNVNKLNMINDFVHNPLLAQRLRHIAHKAGTHDFASILKDYIGSLNEEEVSDVNTFLDAALSEGNEALYEKYSSDKVPDFKPRLDLITSLSLPLERRCKVCGKPISSGEYCDKCGKQLVGKNYV